MIPTGWRPLAAVGRTAVAHAGAVVAGLARAAGINQRGVWSRPGRHHIEVRGVAEPAGGRLGRRVEAALSKVPGVAWARINPPTGRVVVAVEQPGPSLDQLMSVISGIERNDGYAPDPDIDPPHPPEEGPRTGRAVTTLAADTLGLGLAVATRVLPFTSLPGEFAGLLKVVDLHPRLHMLAGKGLQGAPRADSVLPLAESLAHGLSGGWPSIVLDTGRRLLEWQEARAELAAWEKAEARLTGTPERAAAPCIAQDRPVAKPDGPVERYAVRVMAAGALAGAATLPFGGAKRAAAVALSTLPKAAAAGREGYAARLGALLARRGVVVVDRDVLRELDRIDTLVVDPEVLRSSRAVLTDLVPLPAPDDRAPDEQETVARAFALFDADHPTGRHTADGWELAPVGDLAPGAGAEQVGELRKRVDTVLGLAHDGRLVALAGATAEPARASQVLPDAARRAGLRLVVATPDTVPLASTVRDLQADGAMVMLVSGDRRALAAADCGIGTARTDGLPAWGAHLIVDTDIDVAAMVVEAAGGARRMIQQCIVLSGAGTGLGAVTALTSPPGDLPGRSQMPLHLTAAVALGNGVWRANELPRNPPTPPAPTTPWHLMPVPVVFDRLGSGPAGLTDEEAGRRVRQTGGEPPAGAGFARAFVDELANPLTPVLALGAGLSAAVGSVVDAGLVGGVLALSALVGAAQQAATEHALGRLFARAEVTVRVRRGGTEQTISGADLVPGDLVLLCPGDAVPADCRVIEAVGLETDESSLTGESLPVGKDTAAVVAGEVADRRSMVYQGTSVAAGHGAAVVVATGADTEAGRGMALARGAAPASGVEARLTHLTSSSLPLAAGAAVAVAGAGLLHGVPLAQTAATAANLAVASVPEGLPFLVSAAQLAAARRLANHGALVRNPRTIEALGRVDVLCFDKTGTLTEGRLRLAGVGDPGRYAALDELSDELRPVLAAALRATPEADDPADLPQQTDAAVLAGARAAGIGPDTGSPGWHLTAALPFEASRGYHATVGGPDGALLLSVKGAPEVVLPRCSLRRDPGGDVPLDAAGRSALQELLTGHAAAGQRVLAVAECPVATTSSVADGDVEGLTFLGFVALADVVRDSAAPAVRRIREAGVHTIMVTGDHPATAAAIAAIISTDGPGQRVATGAELDALDDPALAERLAATDVVARCTPAHKVRIIQALRGAGRTVAMTGDGANDAPAIRLADVGIALGQRGTPAAHAAADLVVTDDRLETIIATLVEGRAMWSSVRHALSVLVGGNLGEIAFSVVTAAVTGRSALSSRQLLLVNLLTDLAPAMAIAVRPPRPEAGVDLLAEGPDASLGASLNREIGLRAGATTFGATAGWTLARATGRRKRAGTVALAALVGTQLGQTVLTGGASPAVLATAAVSVGALVAVIQTPGLSQFFGCTPLGPVGWGIATGSAACATVANTALGRLILPGTNPRPTPDQAAPDGAAPGAAPAPAGAAPARAAAPDSRAAPDGHADQGDVSGITGQDSGNKS
ncbi:cation-translocating P-type ATPase [Polymorphospora sp. NPDC051019]|uniref:cation-translocating P-type ATPase n=1 Tax=Polymorphospora sp. NPDC051019 TaxID=3155725 RepID=UPI00342D3510